MYVHFYPRESGSSFKSISLLALNKSQRNSLLSLLLPTAEQSWFGDQDILCL